MALPNLTELGELPQGVHAATLREVLERFGGGLRQRQAVADRLQRIYSLAMSTGHLGRFVVFGSFVTDNPQPNDVDVFLVMEDTFEAGLLQGEQKLLFDHAAADVHFGASVFWVRQLAALGGVQAAIEFWQTKRDGAMRGIIEIVDESP